MASRKIVVEFTPAQARALWWLAGRGLDEVAADADDRGERPSVNLTVGMRAIRAVDRACQSAGVQVLGGLRP